MTNNLKLKVFDKNDRALHDVILVNYENDYDIVVEWYNNKNEKRSAFVNEVPVLKTPGLCDINGKLIFEGDIFVKKYFYPFYNYKNKEDKKQSLDDTNGEIVGEPELCCVGVVELDDEGFCFKLHCTNERYSERLSQLYTEFDTDTADECEVIGNIYENPELIGKRVSND